MSRLKVLCERGTVSRDAKKRFCAIKSADTGELVFAVCAELLRLFEQSVEGSAEYAAAAQAVTEFLNASSDDLKSFSKEIAAVKKYVELTARCNAHGAPEDFAKLKASSRTYNESLQNIKYGLPIFGLRSDDGK